MRKSGIIIILVLAITGIAAALFFIPQKSVPLEQLSPAKFNLSSMLLTSPSFKDEEYIPKKFSCEGGDINPQLDIQNAPGGAKSLALIMHDPDAPMPGGFTHWVVWNISPKTASIKEESVPPGSEEGANGSGKTGYVGPCPPSGTHHYHFTLYALDTMLNLPPATGKKKLEAAMDKHIMEKTELVGLYEKGR